MSVFPFCQYPNIIISGFCFHICFCSCSCVFFAGRVHKVFLPHNNRNRSICLILIYVFPPFFSFPPACFITLDQKELLYYILRLSHVFYIIQGVSFTAVFICSSPSSSSKALFALRTSHGKENHWHLSHSCCLSCFISFFFFFFVMEMKMEK